MRKWGKKGKLTNDGNHQLVERMRLGDALNVPEVVHEAVGVRNQKPGPDLDVERDRALGEDVLKEEGMQMEF